MRNKKNYNRKLTLAKPGEPNYILTCYVLLTFPKADREACDLLTCSVHTHTHTRACTHTQPKGKQPA